MPETIQIVAQEFCCGVSEKRFLAFLRRFQMHHIFFQVDIRKIPVCDISKGEVSLLPKHPKRLWRFYVSPDDYERAKTLTADLPRYSNEREQLVTFRLLPSTPAEEEYESFPDVKVWMPLDK